MTPHAAPPYSDSPTRRATVATAPPAAGCCVSRASAVSVVRGPFTTASTARARAAAGDPSVDSSVTVEPAGRSCSVRGPAAFVGRRAGPCRPLRDHLEHPLHRLHPFAGAVRRPAPRRVCPSCVAQEGEPVLRDQLRLQPRAGGDEG
eukprot:6188423-Pleurochrysis_carterae.AAC.3